MKTVKRVLTRKNILELYANNKYKKIALPDGSRVRMVALRIPNNPTNDSNDIDGSDNSNDENNTQSIFEIPPPV